MTFCSGLDFDDDRLDGVVVAGGEGGLVLEEDSPEISGLECRSGSLMRGSWPASSAFVVSGFKRWTSRCTLASAGSGERSLAALVGGGPGGGSCDDVSSRVCG